MDIFATYDGLEERDSASTCRTVTALPLSPEKKSRPPLALQGLSQWRPATQLQELVDRKSRKLFRNNKNHSNCFESLDMSEKEDKKAEKARLTAEKKAAKDQEKVDKKVRK